MIRITKSEFEEGIENATQEDILQQTRMHIGDVSKGLSQLGKQLMARGDIHDHTKMSGIKDFHSELITDFKTDAWWKKHKATERHHLQDDDGVRENVNLLDVVECVVDCVMAGMARGGDLRKMEIPSKVLQKAVQNMADQLAKDVVVDEPR